MGVEGDVKFLWTPAFAGVTVGRVISSGKVYAMLRLIARKILGGSRLHPWTRGLR